MQTHDLSETVTSGDSSQLLAELTKLQQEHVSVAKVEKLFKLITDNVVDLLAIVQPDGTRLWNNHAYLTTLGYKPESLEGTYSLDEVHPDDLPLVQQVFQESLLTGVGRKVEYRMRHRQGHWINLESQARVVTNEDGVVECIVLVAHDITARKKMDEERIKAKKIEAVSSMASGVGHEFKNILENLIAHINAAQSAELSGTSPAAHLDRADQTTRQAQQVVARLLSLGMDEGHINMVSTELEPLLTEVIHSTLARSSTKKQISIPPALEPVSINPTTFAAALKAVINNALESMQNSGILTVSVSRILFDLNSESKPPQLAPGHYLCILIEDEGPGVAPGAIDRVFEPYFSTKTGQAGLGLTSALSVLSRHNGTILIDSKLNDGTKVRLYIPYEKSAVPTQESKPKPHFTGPKKVLFMDDEELVRKFVGTLLKQLGYDVTVAKDGKEVIDLYGQALADGWSYDAVIMDLIIPRGVGGAAAVHTLKKMDPNIVAIASSGYIDQPVMQDPRPFGFTAAIAKPYNRERLSEVLKTSLTSTLN
jgi:PAS domain S-box-containing protein